MDAKEFDAAIIIEEPDEFDEAEKECENEFGANKSVFSKSEKQLKPITEELISEALTSLINDDCLSEESHKAFHRVAQADMSDMLGKMAFLESCLVSRGRFPSAAAEKSFANFHKVLGENISNFTETFELSSGDTFMMCLRLFTRLVDLNYTQPSSSSAATTDMTAVTEEEKDILHYIGGSVVSSLRHKLREDEGKSDILKCLVTEKPPEDSSFTPGSHSSLTSLYDRGGLTYIKSKAVICFEVMEMEFRSLAACKQQTFLNRCYKNAALSGAFYDCTYKSVAEENDKEEILEKMLKLFFKIRVHHKCKMTMDKYRLHHMTMDTYRLHHKISSKQKGLRKGLKTSVD